MPGDHSLTALRTGRLNLANAALVLVVSLSLLPGCGRNTARPDELLRLARLALSKNEYVYAEQIATRIPANSPERVRAVAVAGEAAGKLGRTDDAVRHYLELADLQQKSRQQPLGCFYAAEILRDAGRLTDAERYYLQFLADDPGNALTHERLAFLTSVTGRRWESLPHYFFLIRSGTATVQELVMFADLDRPIEQRPFLESCYKKAPDDRLAQSGLASHSFWEGNLADAQPRLQALVTVDPGLIACQSMLGELLVNQSDLAFLEWHRKLPAIANADPDIAYVRGLWARTQDRPQVAARCFWETIRMAPTHRRATFQLAQVLRLIDHPASEAVEARSMQLIELTQEIDRVLRTKSQNQEPFQKVAVLLEQMGRVWEAGAWGVVARKAFPEATWPQQLLSRVAGRLNDQLPLVTSDENLALRYDFSQFPEFASLVTDRASGIPAVRPLPRSAIHFLVAVDGPDFQYWNGADSDTPGARQFEQTGGGVGVLDYDADGWPDLFFPQGLDWRTGSISPEISNCYSDGLFRNRGGERWDDVSTAARMNDTGFGQGCAAGDFDNDGFQDLYVANVGRNQLLHNNGDGTFSDVTEVAGVKNSDWTTSCVIVDLNADGAPDLYDVNYLTGPGVYEAICQGHACSPSVFTGAEDRIRLSRGDGSFELTPRSTPEVDGKGLGVVAFDLLQRGRPSLFIANDQVPNFLLQNRETKAGDHLRLDDEGFPAGVAFNQDGLAMASMGIAADDVDGDGRIDFCVTTFKDEGSMLFLQTSPGLFVESANTAGLRGPTWSFVGWGAQFLDADLDGDPDLINVNGHVDDYRDEGGEYHMRPQFFRNLGGARFAELPGAEIGPFFSQPRLGRGLARLDWNRDGRMDFAVSHIGDRAALVTNDTALAGHFLNVCLSGRTTARDAIGATVEVVAGDRRWTKQLLAGDGYMACNERLLQFGLGPAETVTRVKVIWPSGAISTVRDVPANRTLELIEQSPRGLLRESPERSEVIATVTGHGE